MIEYRIETKYGQDQRFVEADYVQFDCADGWMIFYRKPPEGGWAENIGVCVSTAWLAWKRERDSPMNMVEKIARAIGDEYETYGQLGALRAKRPSQGLLEAAARAALQALKDPSEGMLGAGKQALDDGGYYCAGNRYARACWQSMIQAALDDV